jgi:ferric iron reductase protein FhuF
MSLDSEIDEAKESIDNIVSMVEKEEKLDDDAAKKIEDFMQWADDRLSELLAKYGVEIGDERID